MTTFPEINAPDLYATLNEKHAYAQQPRYQVSKLLEVLLVRELVARLRPAAAASSSSSSKLNDKKPPVIINLVNPGLCTSNLGLGDEQPSLLVRLLRGSWTAPPRWARGPTCSLRQRRGPARRVSERWG